MTLDEAVALLGPDTVARITARPCPPLRPEQIEHIASLLLGEPVRLPRVEQPRTDAA